MTEIFRTLDRLGQRRVAGLGKSFLTSQESKFSENGARSCDFLNYGKNLKKCVSGQIGLYGPWLSSD